MILGPYWQPSESHLRGSGHCLGCGSCHLRATCPRFLKIRSLYLDLKRLLVFSSRNRAGGSKLVRDLALLHFATTLTIRNED